MITGNPGCIGYYHEFLSLLWDNLGAARSIADISIYGTSLSGFTSGDDDDDDDGAVLGLQGQIRFLETRLDRYMSRYFGEEAAVEHKVIIIGHSVGAYIGLELVRRHQEKVKMGLDRGFDILGYVALWPTLTHIGQSRRGRRLGVRCIVVFIEVLLSLLSIVVIEIALLRLVHKYGSKSADASPGHSSASCPLWVDRLSGTGRSSDSRFSCEPQWSLSGTVSNATKIRCELIWPGIWLVTRCVRSTLTSGMKTSGEHRHSHLPRPN